MRHLTTVVAVLTAALIACMTAPPARADGPGVEITGPMEAATHAVATVGGITGTVGYSWTVDGVVVPSENLVGEPIEPQRLILLEEFIGKQVVVTATVTPEGGSPVVLVSAPRTVVQGTILMNAPRVEGDFFVGRPLRAVPQPAYPRTGLTYSYQWYANRVPVAGATAETWTPGAAYERRSVSVEVSASKAGWTTSAPVRSASDVPLLRLPYVSAAGASLTGDLVAGTGVGVALTRPVGEPYEVSVTWAVDGKPAGSGDVLRLANAMIGLPVTATVTMTADRVAPFTVTTPARIVGPGELWTGESLFTTPAVVGWVARVTSPYEGYPVTQTVTWLRDGRPIPGETGRTYRFTGADVGKTVVARVRATGRGIDATYRWRTGQPVVFNVYTTPGEHQVNGRRWRTACEPYSTTLRCRTDIWATQAVLVNGRWAQRTGWAFNNLSYLPLDGGTWGTNPLARTGEWVDAAGRGWRTECNTPQTGSNACRTYVSAHVTRYEHRRYVTARQWVFNNVVYR